MKNRVWEKGYRRQFVRFYRAHGRTVGQSRFSPRNCCLVENPVDGMAPSDDALPPMEFVLRSRVTQKLFVSEDSWTTNATEAMRFQTISGAKAFIAAINLEGVDIVAELDLLPSTPRAKT